MLFCPDCNHELAPKRVETDAPGGTVEIDRCPFCGGVWLNHFEINRLPTHEAIRLSHLPSFKDTSSAGGLGKCPHCGIALSKNSSAPLLKHTPIRSCPQCQGSWISKHDLARVKQMQDSLLKRIKTIAIPIASIYAVLLPLVLVALLGGGIALTVHYNQQQKETQIRALELIGTPLVIPTNLQGPTRTVALSFTSSVPVTSSLVLTGPQITSRRSLTISDTPKLSHAIFLTGLAANTTYNYTLTVQDEKGQKTELSQSFSTP